MQREWKAKRKPRFGGFSQCQKRQFLKKVAESRDLIVANHKVETAIRMEGIKMLKKEVVFKETASSSIEIVIDIYLRG